MRVAIDMLIIEKEMGGVFFAARALIEGLARVDHTNEYSIITARPKEYRNLANAPNIRIYPLKLRSWRSVMIRHQLLLPDTLYKLRPDVLHVPASAAPIGWHGPLVLTIHDLAFLKVPDQSSLYGQLYWQYLLRESSRRARCIIALSEKTYRELMTDWAIERERLRLIQMQSFTIEQCAEATIRVYQEAMGIEQPPALLTETGSQPAGPEGPSTASAIVPITQLEYASQNTLSPACQSWGESWNR